MFIKRCMRAVRERQTDRASGRASERETLFKGDYTRLW